MYMTGTTRTVQSTKLTNRTCQTAIPIGKLLFQPLFFRCLVGFTEGKCVAKQAPYECWIRMVGDLSSLPFKEQLQIIWNLPLRCNNQIISEMLLHLWMISLVTIIFWYENGWCWCSLVTLNSKPKPFGWKPLNQDRPGFSPPKNWTPRSCMEALEVANLWQTRWEWNDRLGGSLGTSRLTSKGGLVHP